MNYKVTLAYDGSKFHGWAIQPNVTTVQQTVINALNKILKEEVKIVGAGRTDAYVHAINQVFSFKTKQDLINMDFKKAMNDQLPNSIRIKSIQVVHDKFNAQHFALNKTYKYVIKTSSYDLFNNDYLYNYNKKINVSLLRKVSKVLLGKHDFLSFSTSELKDTIRTINSITFTKNKDLLIIRINGNGFLRNQVRMMVGSLLDINENKKDINSLRELLSNPKKGSCIRKAPGCGLYLEKINY